MVSVDRVRGRNLADGRCHWNGYCGIQEQKDRSMSGGATSAPPGTECAEITGQYRVCRDTTIRPAHLTMRRNMTEQDEYDMSRVKIERREYAAGWAAGLEAAAKASRGRYREEEMGDYYRLEGHTPVKCADVMEWGHNFEGSKRHVAQDFLPNDVRVSTVFLGLNHNWGQGPPLLFETMIFGGPHDQYQERYSTWEQAEAGHAVALKLAGSEVPKCPS